MPIYEFYCADCNTIFNFFSSRINTEKRPKCPKCNRFPLDKLISRFSFLKGTKEQDDVVMPELDERKMQNAMSLLDREAKNINEGDPRQAAHLIRKLLDTTGTNFGSGFEEALSRMEDGEDPDKIEEDIGDILSERDFFKAPPKSSPKTKKPVPERDETLYYL